jgi:chromosome segregation ATPase
LAMAIIVMLFAGAGGAGGYFFHGSAESGAPKTDQAALISETRNRLNQSEQSNQGLRDELRSSREAYDKLDQETKEQLRAQAAGAGAGSSDEVRKLEAANKDIQQRLTDTAADLDRSNQRITEDEKTITQLNQELQESKSQEAKPRESKSQDSIKSQDQKESKPRPRRASDFESTIRNLEREYGRDVSVPWYAR